MKSSGFILLLSTFLLYPTLSAYAQVPLVYLHNSEVPFSAELQERLSPLVTEHFGLQDEESPYRKAKLQLRHAAQDRQYILHIDLLYKSKYLVESYYLITDETYQVIEWRQ